MFAFFLSGALEPVTLKSWREKNVLSKSGEGHRIKQLSISQVLAFELYAGRMQRAGKLLCVSEVRTLKIYWNVFCCRGVNRRKQCYLSGLDLEFLAAQLFLWGHFNPVKGCRNKGSPDAGSQDDNAAF